MLLHPSHILNWAKSDELDGARSVVAYVEWFLWEKIKRAMNTFLSYFSVLLCTSWYFFVLLYFRSTKSRFSPLICIQHSMDCKAWTRNVFVVCSWCKTKEIEYVRIDQENILWNRQNIFNKSVFFFNFAIYDVTLRSAYTLIKRIVMMSM